MDILKRKKGNYLIVSHHYWMDHKKWETKTLIDVTEKEAKAEAALMETESRKQFNHVNASAFLLPDVIQVLTNNKEC